MIQNDELKQMRNQAISSCELKLEHAKKGHDFIVNSTSVNNYKLIEMTSELLNFREKFGEFEGIKDKGDKPS